MAVPQLRVRRLNESPVRAGGDFVLYWMVAFRRPTWNFSLDHAADLARELNKPLLVLEPLELEYPWACARFHHFILDGMADNARAFARKRVAYYPYVEPAHGAGRGLLAALGARACAVVTDDFPCFIVPARLESAARNLRVRLEAVDSNGLLPLRAASCVYSTAHAFRRFLQKSLRPYLGQFPSAELEGDLPSPGSLPVDVVARWPAATAERLAPGRSLADLRIDHTVAAGPLPGGARAGLRAAQRFLRERLPGYAEQRNEPEREATSGLSPYLHYGHVAVHDVFARLASQEGWAPPQLAATTSGSRRGFWGMSDSAEAFLDQIVTWRELGFNLCWQRADYDRYESLPGWARRTLAEHAADRRDPLYTPEQLENAATQDALWNAAQVQLVREGRIHNYLRMLWGKKILEWSPGPERALEIMIELNDKHALDGRDPGSYNGIFWVLGRYDRAWGPERPIFGKVRYMSSTNTARKVRVRDYVARHAPEAALRAVRGGK